MKQEFQNKKIQKRSKSRKLFFNLILILLPVLFLIFIELVIRATGFGESYKLFLETTFYEKTYKIINPDYGKKYFSRLNYTQPPNDIFLKEKPENGYRIFVLGSSTAAGFPYNQGNTFSRILEKRLQDSYPGTYIEVVNISITAINSYTLYDVVNQILKKQPDAFLIYAGHNEFYGALGIASIEGFSQSRILKLMHLKLQSFRTYQLLNNFIGNIKLSFSTLSDSREKYGETLMESIAAHKSIEYQSDLYKSAHDHYHRNMQKIVKRATKRGVTVLLSQVVGNIRDLKPFVSVVSENYPKACETFRLAREKEKSGHVEEAKELYYYAKDLDGLRFRASEDINRIIDELSNQNGVILVPMKSVFQDNSPDGLTGNNLMTEHVHPTREGYILMADAFYNCIVEQHIIGKPDPANYKPSSYYRDNWGFTPLDSIIAGLRIQQLVTRWPFVKKESDATFLNSYKPVNYLDSVAYKVLAREISMVNAYRKVADYYESNYEYFNAYEYKLAIARVNPHNPVYFTEAGDMIMKDGNYHLALDMYLSSLKHTRQIDQLYRTGEIYLKLGNFSKANDYLQEALQGSSGAISELIAGLLKEIETESGSTYSDRTQQRVIIFAPASVTEKIALARKSINEQNFDQALELLREANEIHETAAANRYIGEILLRFDNKEALIYLRKALHDHRDNVHFISTLCYAAIVFGEKTLAFDMLERIREIEPENHRINMLESRLRELP
jgi:tetratricopeptide (TPR) repeat protein/lysophospholipase L1-like esterase